jgi:hypothetical protein
MSHFLFGVVNGRHGASREAIGGGMEVAWGPGLQQEIVNRMLAEKGKPTPSETTFSLNHPGEDQSESLISPYDVEREVIVENLLHVLTWLERQRGPGTAELWMTEGYDDAFAEKQGTFQELQEVVRGLFVDREQLPSLRLRLVPKAEG